jgi:hypothetical protein
MNEVSKVAVLQDIFNVNIHTVTLAKCPAPKKRTKRTALKQLSVVYCVSKSGLQERHNIWSEAHCCGVKVMSSPEPKLVFDAGA